LGGYHKDALPVGHHLADYVIESVLGFGGFGVTYLARDEQLGSEVAIKEYLPQDISGRIEETRVLPNPDAPNGIRDYQWGLKEFLHEARNLVQFKHPNIVRVLRFMEANGTAYMVMEYEHGESLSHYLKHKPGRRLDEKELLRIFLPVLNGLGAVHKAGMLHLDIKPDNIYLRTDHTPMLIDFGSARQAISGGEHAQRITLTHGFAPIEQYPDKGKPGPWTDLYAIGASMYYCICARRPEISINRYQTLLRHQADPVTPAVKAGEGRYSRYLLECIDWALQIYPKDRPQSVQELQDGLMGKGAPKNGTVQIQIRMPDKARERPSRMARVLRWLIAIVIAVGLGGGGLYVYKPVLAKQLWVKSQRLAKHYSNRFSRLIHPRK
jgi:serine/threonine protein kinase